MCEKVKVYCENREHGIMDFYAVIGEEHYFLFRMDYYDGTVFQTYKNGVLFSKILGQCYQRNGRKIDIVCKRMQKVRDHILRNLKYLEREQDIAIFEQTAKFVRNAA